MDLQRKQTMKKYIVQFHKFVWFKNKL